MYRKGSISLLLIFGTVLHTISLLSSSFVEEEHQTWYFYTVTAHVLIFKSMVELIVNYKTQLHSVDKKKDAEKPTTYDKTKPSLKNPPSPNHNLDCNFKEIHSQHSKSIKLSDGNFNKETDYKSRGNFIPTWKNVVMVITVLVLCRLTRTWNQTGNKWLNIPDVGDWLIRLDS
jgi:ethanolaminephosphotransferase